MKFDKSIFFLLGGFGALLTGVVAVVTYTNNREHQALIKENAKLEHELKLLELELRKYQLKRVNGRS